MELKLYNVAPRMPKELKFLEKLTDNIWWCWHPLAIELFTRIHPQLWKEHEGCAKSFLRHVPQERLEELAKDDDFIHKLNTVEAEFNKTMSGKPGDFSARKVAYFSLEFGIHESIRIFSGGLGVLAGDHLKAASDLGLPLVAVGLLYRQGYFRQVLDSSGWQVEHYPIARIQDLPLVRARDGEGKDITISIRLIDRELFAAVWILWVGNVPLVLLDTELPQNPPDMREITWRLYGGDKRMRLHQELLLGIGGVKALLALGCEPEVCHMNEGHAGFLSLARIAHFVQDKGLDPDVALEIVWRSNVFTTHTPVPAGNEVFDIGLLRPYLAPFAEEARMDINRVIQWGIPVEDRGNNVKEMSMTVFGLRLAANYSNGVSRLHGEVAREMWKDLWPQRSIKEIPIQHITNGVHVQSWVSSRMSALFGRYLPPRWAMNPDYELLRKQIEELPDDELWTTHELCRQHLIREIRRIGQNNLRYLTAAGHKSSFMPDVLTIGFARRFATYKRGALLLRDEQRLLRLLRDTKRPIQFVFAGKAHPADDAGKKLIQQLIQFSQRENVQDKFIFLENYDIAMARNLVQGVDVWLNTPRRPQEASGTSGMKAAVNGIINCSILDGWWAEAYDGENGWAINGNEYYTTEEDQDNYESQQLFDLLENEIIPCFYERGQNDLPVRWIQRMKHSILTGIGTFSSIRMVQDYQNMFYSKAAAAYRELTQNDAAAARKLVVNKQMLVRHFGGLISISEPTVDCDLSRMHVGDTFDVSVQVNLGDMPHELVEVDAYYGTVDAHNQIIKSYSVPMEVRQDLGSGNYVFGCKVVCKKSGRFGLTARIKPTGNDWDNSVPGFNCWPR